MDPRAQNESVEGNTNPNNTDNGNVNHTQHNNTHENHSDVSSNRLLMDIINRSFDEEDSLSQTRTSRFEIYRNRFFGSGEGDGTNVLPARRLLPLGITLTLILVLVFLNSFNSSDNDSFRGDSIIFSTYYTSKYRICVPPEMDTKCLLHSVLGPEEQPKQNECAEGNVDITLFYKDVNLEGYYRVYLALSFELDYQGRWFEVWKDKHFFSTKNKHRRLVISLSNLIYIDNKFNTLMRDVVKEASEPNKLSQKRTAGEAGTGGTNTTNPAKNKQAEALKKDGSEYKTVSIYLNSFIPNFINIHNYKIKDGGGSYRDKYNIYKYNNKLMNSIRLNDWNEFARLFNIYNYNMNIDLKVDPIEYLRSTVTLRNLSDFEAPNKEGETKKGDGTATKEEKKDEDREKDGETKEEEEERKENIAGMVLETVTGTGNGEEGNRGKPERISFRRLDDYYLLNLRKFVQNEYEQLANFSLSWFNLFNVFSTTNPYSTRLKLKLNNPMAKPKVPKEEDKHPEHDTILSKDILNVHFNPVNKFETGSEGGGKAAQNEKDDIVGYLNSNEIPIRVNFTGQEKDMRKLNKMISRFSMLFVLKCLVETLLISKQFRRIDRAAQGQSVSITTVCLMTYQEVLEIFLLLYHGGVFFDNLAYFGFVMFVKFFLLGIVQHSFIVVIWRSNHSYQIRQGWAQIQKSFTLFYRYYFTFVSLLLVIWYFFYSVYPCVISLVYLVWFPQILLDVWRGQNNSLNYLFIVASIVLKLVLPVYTFCVRDNIFSYDKFTTDSIRLNPSLVYFLVFLNSVQLILISVQRLYGARHFASWSILPKIYSYVRPWSKMMQDDPQECVICMYDIIQSNRDWVLTPCDHLFHANCLKEWTEIKLECPNCRRPLPPITQI